MPTNNPLYNRMYFYKRRQKLIEKLGGKCALCGIKTDLIIHRIYHYPVTKESSKQEKKRARELNNNPDNMILLCYNCYHTLIRVYGRKVKIGRKEIREFGKE